MADWGIKRALSVLSKYVRKCNTSSDVKWKAMAQQSWVKRILTIDEFIIYWD